MDSVTLLVALRLSRNGEHMERLKQIALHAAVDVLTLLIVGIFARSLSTWQGWAPPPWTVVASGLLVLKVTSLQAKLFLSVPRDSAASEE